MGLGGRIALGVVVFILALSALAPLITKDPINVDLESLKLPPGAEHPMGTDQKGRDILARTIHGGRISIGVAGVAAVLSMSIGLLIGLTSGYFGGKLDAALMALSDLVLSFPSLLLAVGVSIILPPGIMTVMIAIAAVGWASFARLIRGHVLTLREAPYIEAARAIGCTDTRIILVHILPQCLPLALVMAGLKLGGYILIEASLSFLGLGAQPPAPSWGSMVSAGRDHILSAPWISIFPGLAITVTALCFNVIGDSLSDYFGRRDIRA